MQGFEVGAHHDLKFAGIIKVPENQDSLEYRTYFEDVSI
jgi:hypothetical protein